MAPDQSASFKSTSFRRGLRDTLPLVPPIAVFGAVFGALAIQAGLTPWLAFLCSLLVVSGSAQMAMVGLIGSGAGPVLLATTGLALRHIPMSATLSEMIGEAPLLRRLQLSWVLVDESYGLTVNAAARGEPDVVAYKSGSDLTLYSTWLASTLAGALLGSRLDQVAVDLGIVFPLVFLGLAASVIRIRSQWITAGLAVVAALVAVSVLPVAWQISGAAIAAAAIGSRFK